MTGNKKLSKSQTDWPQDLAKIQVEKKSCCSGKKLNDCFKSFLSHASYCVVLVVYTAVGALIFQVLEHPYEVQTTTETLKDYELEKVEFINYLTNIIENSTNFNLSSVSWKTMIEEKVETYEEVIINISKNGIDPRLGIGNYRWTYSSSLFFAATVISTVGYGHICPVTIGGRIFCICFALFGIPVLLLTVTDIGKLFANLVYQIYQLICKKMLCCRSCQHQKQKPPKQNNNLPYIVTCLIVVIYIAIGSSLFATWEEWTFFESFYFCFITMTTIGFGDIVPKHKMFMLLCTVYIIIGLALTSMCIELAGKQYVRSIKKVKKVGKVITVQLPKNTGKFKIKQNSHTDKNVIPLRVKDISQEGKVKVPLLNSTNPDVDLRLKRNERNSIILMERLEARETKV